MTVEHTTVLSQWSLLSQDLQSHHEPTGHFLSRPAGSNPAEDGQHEGFLLIVRVCGAKQDGVHCGRGDRLHVLFLDKDGKTSDFPPRAEAGWGTAAKYACRVYVRT